MFGISPVTNISECNSVLYGERKAIPNAIGVIGCLVHITLDLNNNMVIMELDHSNVMVKTFLNLKNNEKNLHIALGLAAGSQIFIEDVQLFYLKKF